MKIIKNMANIKDDLLQHLYNDNPIIIPTDTNYNLACIPTSKIAIDKIFKFKERKKDKPLSLFFLDPSNWYLYGKATDKKVMNILVNSFWPGPLNIILDKIDNRFDYMLNNSMTISLGCIKNDTWRKLLSLTKIDAIAITSANISGTVDNKLVTEDIAFNHMENKVEYLISSNKKPNTSKSSTIIRVIKNGVKIVRLGDITKEDLERALIKDGYHVY
ncbi:MAG: Threonylcarbamoyl-AMP synthase [Candidatus Celerinatantimonas neptuna]|nr:MAG: Threonylcarbamoyl-AMP synthase [Candidatus Celerinatantimonas neptuna]